MDNNSDINDDRWVEDRLETLRPENGWQPDAVRGLAGFRKQREKKSNRLRRWSWLAASVLAAGIPLMAISSTREFAHRCVSACVGESSWAVALFRGNAPAPVPSAVYVKAGDRRIASDFTLKDASGKSARLSDFRGKVVLLNFWATWCGPCRVEIPWFKEFDKALQSRGFETIGVAMDEDGWNAVNPYVEEHEVSYRVMMGNDDVAQLYGANSLPTTFIIDRSGRIAATHIGLCGKNEYEADIRAVLEEQ